MRRVHSSAARAAFLSAVVAASAGCGGDSDGTETSGKGPAASPLTPKEACDALAGKTIGDAAISSAELLAADGQVGERCKVTGSLHTTLKFEAALPTEWNKKLLYWGGGGWDGYIPEEGAGSPSGITGGYVTVGSNGGHDDPTGAVFAESSTAQKDFGYLSIHTVLDAVKLIVKQRYGADAERYYFEGCSNGGREALIQATRWPADFDGIVVRAPAYSFTELLLAFNNNMKHMVGTSGGLISVAKAGAIAAAVVKDCDEIDGLADGIVSDIESCAFDPDKLLCAGADADDCLTEEQVNTLKAIYSEFKPSGGSVSPYPGWGPSGEDLGFPAWLIGDDKTPPLQLFFSEGLFRYWITKDKTFDSLTFDPAKYMPQIKETAETIDATADLKAFFARKGKMILVHGTSDWAISYKGSIKYWNNVAAAVGGEASRDESMEFYLQPGVQHCAGGVGPDTIDLVEPMVKWVEEGKRPSSANLVSSKLDMDGKVTLTRPLCRYPMVPRYSGSGDPNAATSFTCEKP